MWWLALFLCQQPQADQIRAAMAKSIEQQLASVKQQLQASADSQKPDAQTVAMVAHLVNCSQ